MKQKLLRIDEVKIDDRVYPRASIDSYVIAKYVKAMKSGSVFPPIIVAKYEGKYLLVDGAHRLTTNKQLKNTHIEAEILELFDLKEIYIESIKRNSVHGTSFTTMDVTKICLKLKEMRLSLIEISQIVHIPADKIEPYVAKRIMRIGETRQEIPLSPAFRHFAGEHLEEPIDQGSSISSKQIDIINSLISLLENKYINLQDEKVLERLKKISELLKEII